MKKIILFASGNGSNAVNIVNKRGNHFQVIALFCNNPNALVIEKMEKLNIPVHLFDKSEFESELFKKNIERLKPDLIVLAGFLWLLPSHLTERYDIINIHPSLLPRYGGKGMYGMRVHEAVIKGKEKESGITIHKVNGVYDDGQIIFQASCALDTDETAQSLAKKIHRLEHQFFPQVIIDTLK